MMLLEPVPPVKERQRTSAAGAIEALPVSQHAVRATSTTSQADSDGLVLLVVDLIDPVFAPFRHADNRADLSVH